MRLWKGHGMTRAPRAALPVAATLAVACLLAPAMAVGPPAADEVITFGSSAEDAPVVAPGRYEFTMPANESENFLSVERKIWVSGHQELYAVAITVPGCCRSMVSPLKP